MSGTSSWNQTRMTVDELEKLQFIAAEKARQVGDYISSSFTAVFVNYLNMS